MKTKQTYKASLTIKDYPTTFGGYTFTVPAGSKVSNMTACGSNDEYRFLEGVSEVAEKVTGLKGSILRHDLIYYGLNIPQEYCEPYKAD